MDKISTSHAIRVTFVIPPFNDMRKEYHFGSLADLFCKFTPEQVGTNLLTLWNKHHIGSGEKVRTEKCTIERIDITHYLHKKATENLRK